MKFKELQIGDSFEFDNSRFRTSGMERGPWTKTSPRKYEKPNMKCTVGSINTKVIKGEDK